MRPETRIWRKTFRASSRRTPRRQGTVRVQTPRRGSTWLRRHPGLFGFYVTHAGTARLITEIQRATAVDAARPNALTPSKEH